MLPRTSRVLYDVTKLSVSGADREPAARVGVGEERMPVQLVAEERLRHACHVLLCLTGLVGCERRGLFRLRALDLFRARASLIVLLLLRGGGSSRGEHENHNDGKAFHDDLLKVTMTPPGTASGATATRDARNRIVTVRPLTIPSAAPNTTSLAQCWRSATRDAAV